MKGERSDAGTTRDRFGNRRRVDAPRLEAPAPSPVPSTPPAAAAEIVLTAGSRRGEHHWITRVFSFVAVTVVVSTAAVAGWYVTHRPDAHYLEAQAMLAEYEIGKPEAARNYDHSVYDGALARLGRVDPGSVSADPAAALTQEIQVNRRRFREARLERERDFERARLKELERAAAARKARRLSRLLPVTEFPECEEAHSGPSDSRPARAPR